MYNKLLLLLLLRTHSFLMHFTVVSKHGHRRKIQRVKRAIFIFIITKRALGDLRFRKILSLSHYIYLMEQKREEGLPSCVPHIILSSMEK